MRILFIDIDGVMSSLLSTGNNKWSASEFIPKAVNSLNSIIKKTDCEIILSSSWKHDYSLVEIREIFAYNGVIKGPIGFTPNTPKTDGMKLQESRAKEILTWLELHDWKNQIKWTAVDDMNLDEWLYPNFILSPLDEEGLGYKGLEERIIKILLDRNTETTMKQTPCYKTFIVWVKDTRKFNRTWFWIGSNTYDV